MECKGCGKAFAESELKQVGVWNFCASCFGNLMAEASPPSGEAAGDTAGVPAGPPGETESDEASPPLVIRGEQVRCTVCDVPLRDGEGHDMGILTVCPSCYQELITRPEPVRIQEDEPGESDLPDDDPGPPLPDPMETVSCAGCRRTIKKIAAKVHQDDLYCPDCFYQNNYDRIEQQNRE